MNVQKVRIGDLKFDDELIEMRPINDLYVSRYRQALRVGAAFPPLMIDKKTKTIISGNTRVTAMLKEFGEEHEADAIVKAYKSEADKIIEFAEENSKHGNPLSSYSRSCIAIRLIELGKSEEEVARLFNVAKIRVDEWCNKVTTVVGNRNKKEYKKTMPVKRGASALINKEITEEEYKEHKEHDRGLSIGTQANQILSWLRKGWIDKNDIPTMQLLKSLADEIYSYIE